MSPYLISCALCGVTIPIDGITTGPTWTHKYKAVCATPDEPNKAYLSGTGGREPLGDFIYPSNDSPGVEGPQGIWLMPSSFRPSDSPFTADDADDPRGFPFHVSCWNMLAVVRPQDPINIQALHGLLRSYPIDDGILNFGHDYGGLLVYEPAVGKLTAGAEPSLCRCIEPELDDYEVDVDEEDELDEEDEEHENEEEDGQYETNIQYEAYNYCGEHDPYEIPVLKSFLKREHETESNVGTEVARFQTRGAGASEDVFSKIPMEILHHILEHLSSKDVAHLRKSSRAAANMPLQNSFWKSRFLPGREYDFIFEAARHGPFLRGRWKSLFNFVKGLVNDAAVVNRERVWELALSMRDILDGMGESECAGDAVQSFFEPDAPGDDRRWTTASRSLNTPSSHFTNGRRSLWERAITLPNEPVIPCVSGCEVFGRFYISAIELEMADGMHLCLGYRHAASKSPLCAEKVVITGFCLAEDERGIRGISVLSAGGIMSEWVGEYHGLSKRMLVLSSTGESKVGHLKGGFDALKFVSLSISHRTPLQPDPGDSLTLRDSATWFPDIPDVRISSAGIKERAATSHVMRSPLCLVLPPAPLAAEGWPRIRQVRAGISHKKYIVSLDVHYSNQDRAVGLELENTFPHQTIVLDMDSDDEQIVSADAFYGNRDTFVGFKLYTNLGRTKDFNPDSWGNYRGAPAHMRSFFPQNNRLVGFCFRVNRWSGLADIAFAHVPN